MSELHGQGDTPRKPTLWERWKPLLGGLALGLVVGPFLSGYLGWQVTSATLHESVEDAIVQQQARMCAMLARQEEDGAALAEMGYVPRREVAKRHAGFPWNDTYEHVVTNRCTNLLDEPSG